MSTTTLKPEWTDPDWKMYLINHLTNEYDVNVVVNFTKNDGSLRSMRSTLDAAKIPEYAHPDKSDDEITQDVASLSYLRVYDLDKQGWRTFNWDSIQSVEITV